MAAHMQPVLITGGCGFVGLRLGSHLAIQGHLVTLFDRQPPRDALLPGVSFVAGDICELADIAAALSTAKAELVFHVASYGMSGRESLHWQRIYNVNVGGTANLISACCMAGTVRRIVYTSTYNVVFCGREIVSGDESLGYADPQSADAYSRSKALAERSILDANGTPLDAEAAADDERVAARSAEDERPGATSDRTAPAALPLASSTGRGDRGSRLLTCAVRPAAIYGPGELRHTVRMIGMVRAGLFLCTFGSRGSLVDWVHVDNLVDAMTKAAHGLTADKKRIAAGQAYFISDGRPVNNFQFLRPILEGLGYSYPRVNVPYQVVYYLSWLMEAFAACLSHVVEVVPLLSRAEVDKCSITHYFRIDKARQELGYEPRQRSMDEVVAWYREAGYARSSQRCSSVDSRRGTNWSLMWYLMLIAVAVVLLTVLNWLPSLR